MSSPVGDGLALHFSGKARSENLTLTMIHIGPNASLGQGNPKQATWLYLLSSAQEFWAFALKKVYFVKTGEALFLFLTQATLGA